MSSRVFPPPLVFHPSTRFVECSTDEEVQKIEEWIGRAYARFICDEYPIPPDFISAGRQPADLPQYFGRRFTRAYPISTGGGVFIVTTQLESFAIARQEQFEDGDWVPFFSSHFSFNNAILKYAELSVAGKKALDPPPPRTGPGITPPTIPTSH